MPDWGDDLFAGAGGFDVAARRLGILLCGYEHWLPALKTRRAAGMMTNVSVSGGDVCDGFEPAGGLLVGGPPCQTFTNTGNGSGRREMHKLLHAIEYPDQPQSFSDDRTALVLEPMRWLRLAEEQGHRYESVVLEQVPAVLPVWEAYAVVLRRMGYSVVTGVLNAEQYGVPQTRRRAVLLARHGRPVELPVPTHRKFRSKDESLPAPVSMNRAMRPAPPGAGSLRSNYGTGGDASKRGIRTVLEPAPTITSKFNRNKWLTWDGDVYGPLTVEQASILQTFLADHPWQGTAEQVQQQIGNAIPPLLAEALLREVVR